MAEELRLVHQQPGSPSWNMAVDEALLMTAGPPVLRFYTWQPFGLSLGYFQPELPDSERAKFSAAGIEVVRRLTGGGAILHAHELTYSLTGSDGSGPFSGGVDQSYHLVHRLIVQILRELGLHAQLASEAPPALKHSEQPFLCFARSTALDIVVGSNKVVGSAKRRRGGRALQHGSIILRQHPLADISCGLSDLLDAAIDLDFFQEQLATRLAAVLGLGLEPDTLSPEVLELARGLQKS